MSATKWLTGIATHHLVKNGGQLLDFVFGGSNLGGVITFQFQEIGVAGDSRHS